MAIAIPIALQNLLTTTASMVDTMMVGELGQQSVGALGLCGQFSSLMFSCYWGFIGGGMLFFAQYFGAKNDDGINRSYGMTLTCMMTVAVIFTLAGLLVPEKVLELYTDKTVFREIGVKYLRIVCLAYPLQVYSMGMAALLRTTERVRIPLIGAIASVATNIVLNFCLIRGRLGFPALGVEGAAIASVIAAFVNVLTIGILAKKSGHKYIFAFAGHFRWNKRSVREYFKKCAPIIANELLIGIGNMVINVVLGRQPEDAIAALAVFRTLEGLVIGFFAGFSNAASVLVGTEVGAGKPELAWKRAIRLVYLCMGVIFMLMLVLVFVHTPLLHVMSLNGNSFDICFGMLLIFFVAVLFRMANWTMNDTYRSAGDATFGTLLEITFMYLMVLPCVYLSGMVFSWTFLIVFALCYVDEPIRFVLMQIHMYSGKWIKPVTPQGIEALREFRLAHPAKSRRK